MINLGCTYRAVTPQETLAKLTPMLWKNFGITRVANITGLHEISHIPVYAAIQPLSKYISTSQGKGTTHELAKISAIMESIERWHAEQALTPYLFGSSLELKNNYPLVNLELLLKYSPQHHLQDIEKIQFYWSKGLELNTGKEIYFPTTYLDLDHTKIHQTICAPHIDSNTNGLAAGNTLNEAICHAIFELIERDCWKTLLYSTKKKRIDPTSIMSPHLLALIKNIPLQSMELKIFDITNEINVPTFFATLTDTARIQHVGTFWGAGTHFSTVVALSRAITEMIQSRVSFISGLRDDLYPSKYEGIKNVTKKTPTRISSESKFHSFTETQIPGDFKQCIHKLLRHLNQAGYNQVISYEYTQKNIDIPVVKIIIPGLYFDASAHRLPAYMHR